MSNDHHSHHSETHFTSTAVVRDIVIGMEALARGHNAFANFYGNWCSLINIWLGHCVLNWHQHRSMLTAFAGPGPVGRMAPAAP